MSIKIPKHQTAPTHILLYDRYKVQYLAGAPITMHIMLNHPEKFKFDHEVSMSNFLDILIIEKYFSAPLCTRRLI
jgi:hypothetical protein